MMSLYYTMNSFNCKEFTHIVFEDIVKMCAFNSKLRIKIMLKDIVIRSSNHTAVYLYQRILQVMMSYFLK